MGDPFTFDSRATLPPTGPSTTGTDDVTLYQPRALQTGEIIGHYRIEAPLGQGGNGTAYAARNIDDEDERVAIKLIRPDRRDRARLARLLRAEAAALRRVKHEGIVQYRTFKRIPESDEYYLVTEHIEGPTLGACLRERALTADETRRLAIRVCDALETAHAQGVIHRDLSPDNIILPGGDPNRATLIDFGIAKQGAIDPFGVDFVGKLAFAAPEQFDGDPSRIGPWTDLYSLGLTLVAAARGRRLDMGQDMESAVEARRRLPDLSDLLPALRGPIASLLAADPDMRVRSAAAAAALFAAQGNDETILASALPQTITATQSANVRRPGPSRRLMAAMIIAALVLLTAGAGAFYLLNPSAPPSPAAPVQAAPSPPAAPGPALPKKATTLHPKVALAATLGRTAAGMARLAKLQAGIAAEDAEAIAAKARTVATAARDAARLGSEAAAKACLRGPVEGLACKTLPDGSTEAGEQSCDGNACVWNGHVSVSTGAYVFDGVMENGKFKLGTMLIEDGSRYSGEFEDRAPNGLGRMRLNDGVEMIGAFAHGSLEGLGRLEFPSTDATRISYAGMFHDGQKSGPGVFAWRNGETSSGIFDRDALTGYAVEEDSDQRTEGRYQDWFATIGVSHYADGTRYEGAFGTQPAPNDEKVTAREGPGVLFAADGTILRQGIWRNDRLSEPLQ